jgi:hypothetical protein
LINLSGDAISNLNPWVYVHCSSGSKRRESPSEATSDTHLLERFPHFDSTAEEDLNKAFRDIYSNLVMMGGFDIVVS